jgi:hypothetical protein
MPPAALRAASPFCGRASSKNQRHVFLYRRGPETDEGIEDTNKDIMDVLSTDLAAAQERAGGDGVGSEWEVYARALQIAVS